MKKTLIALAVASSVVIPFSVMAWDVNGSGGSVNIGGSLTPAENITPWEVKTGAAVTGLDAEIQKGQSVINIAVDKTIPILGIRTIQVKPFQGGANITPNINYGDAIDTSKFSKNATTLTLDLKDANGGKIGKLETLMSAMGRVSRGGGVSDGDYAVYASAPGESFYGGLPVNENGIDDSNVNLPELLFPDVMDNFDSQGNAFSGKGFIMLHRADITYSGAYGSAIEQGKIIKISLDQSVAGDALIHWKASLPVTVSYQ